MIVSVKNIAVMSIYKKNCKEAAIRPNIKVL